MRIMTCRYCGRKTYQTKGVHFINGKWYLLNADYCVEHGSFVNSRDLKDAEEVTPDPTVREHIRLGLHVLIYLKENQLIQKPTEGYVGCILTKSFQHNRGIKVRLTDGRAGRIVKILE